MNKTSVSFAFSLMTITASDSDNTFPSPLTLFTHTFNWRNDSMLVDSTFVLIAVSQVFH